MRQKVLRKVGTFHNTTRRENPEDIDLNLYSRENLNLASK